MTESRRQWKQASILEAFKFGWLGLKKINIEQKEDHLC